MHPVVYINLGFLTLILRASQTTAAEIKKCSLGWFGTDCRFQCHCIELVCHPITGACAYGCQRGWIGPSCQYHMAASNLPTWATDGDSRTCNDAGLPGASITAWLNNPIRLTWIILQTKSKADLKRVEVMYKASLRPGLKKCPKMKSLVRAISKESKLEILCPTTTVVHAVIVTGHATTALCSIEISMGRNLALLGKTSFSPPFPRSAESSARAIDGKAPFLIQTSNEKAASSYNMCAISEKAEENTTVTWSLEFDFIVRVNMVVIRGCCGATQGASVKLQQMRTHDHTFTVATSRSYVEVPRHQLEMVHAVSISGNGSDGRSLSVCEVELWGDCRAGYFGLDCTRMCLCDHHLTCSATGQCLNECAPGFTGRHCEQPCKAGYYGPECKMQCHPVCDKDKCEPRTGFCPSICPLNPNKLGCFLTDITIEGLNVTDEDTVDIPKERGLELSPVATAGIIIAFACVLLGVSGIAATFAYLGAREDSRKMPSWGSNICDPGSEIQSLDSELVLGLIAAQDIGRTTSKMETIL